MPVKLPDPNPKRQLARRVFDALISGIPLAGGPYAAMLSVTHPPIAEQLQNQWQADVTAAVNNMEKVIDDLLPAIPLSDLAAENGVSISANSKLGRGEIVDFVGLRAEFADAPQLEIEDALGELAHAELLDIHATIGQQIAYVAPRTAFYEVFDPVAFDGVNPRSDAAGVAQFILSTDTTVSAESIMDEFGWSVRRYNPAIGIVCTMIGEGRKSREIHPTISWRSVMPDSSERAALRNFADRVLRARPDHVQN